MELWPSARPCAFAVEHEVGERAPDVDGDSRFRLALPY